MNIRDYFKQTADTLDPAALAARQRLEQEMSYRMNTGVADHGAANRIPVLPTIVAVAAILSMAILLLV